MFNRTTTHHALRRPGCVHLQAQRRNGAQTNTFPAQTTDFHVARTIAIGMLLLILLCCIRARAADLPADWQHEQTFDVPAAGLVKLNLPVETLGRARPGLEDLRLHDDAGNEVPYFLERPVPGVKVTQNAKSFEVILNPANTVITIETGLAQPLDAVTLVSPASGFIKPVRIEGSEDGRRWQALAQGQPIFRRFGGLEQLRLPVTPGRWPWLRLTVDDRRSPPVPFTGARVHAATAEPVASEQFDAAVVERHENPGETRLTLDLGAANEDIAAIQIETGEPIFTRQVVLAVPEVHQDSIREEQLAEGVIYRVAIEGQPVTADLSVPVERQVRSHELLLLIRNQDSPPLPIKAVRVQRRPVHLGFFAPQPGRYHLLIGNSHCAPPRYDLAALGANFKTAAISPVTLSALTNNPNYRPPEALPGIQAEGVTLDVAAWKFRKAIHLTNGGAQQLELDLDVLSHAQPGFGDLRLMRDGRQVPYIVKHTSISRALTPAVTVTNDARDRTLSRWVIKLPQSNLPLTRLACVSPTALFKREVFLQEELSDERGGKYRRALGHASWVRTPGDNKKELVIALDGPPRSDTLYLETQNGDNPAIELEKLQCFYPVTRLMFKAGADDAMFLYYGNPSAGAPHYDLGLAAGQLLAADKSIATPAAAEQLGKSGWAEGRTAGQGGVILWSILALVVVVLLVVISKLLPKPKV